ncbi:MAG: ActS/PrrB/RegB family redox-sensitive histidine kinase [Rhodospirillaceae bacterium]|jgi:two-component system, sensor histidine kinase RegB|nr:ActS/PrrB/RegB family redox-sensitive histidine kinase [Rhodospirillaceae bacterium]MBT6136338.1 ActS/PrrB/RegB family redox-sensitive histidine kinase [Rhodospirillaceae bacterium]
MSIIENRDPARFSTRGDGDDPGLPVSLRTLANIRWVALGGQVAALLFVRFGLGFELEMSICFAVVAISAVLNVYVQVGRGAQARLSDQRAALFLAFDITQLSILLYLTGGLSNPFALLMLAPVTVSASILSFSSTVRLCLMVLIAATILMVWHRPLPWSGGELILPTTYVIGLWTALVIAVLFIAAYIWRVAAEARDMSEALAAMHEALSREQRMSALGGLAAAAAHELGSPLSTIAVIATELARDVPPDSELAEDVALLQSETGRCREILTRLSRDQALDEGSALNEAPLSAIVQTAADEYQRDGVEIIIERQGQLSEEEAGPPVAEPTVIMDPELLHSLRTLIHNATQFANETVEISVNWDGQGYAVIVEDDGPGFPIILLDRLGEPYVSTRAGQDGHMGLGVFIAKTLLRRIGGDLRFANRPEGGARVSVHWHRADSG